MYLTQGSVSCRLVLRCFVLPFTSGFTGLLPCLAAGLGREHFAQDFLVRPRLGPLRFPRHGGLPVNLPELIEQYGTEEKCREYLEQLRWPDGIECPRCQSHAFSRIRKLVLFDCDSCRYKF